MTKSDSEFPRRSTDRSRTDPPSIVAPPLSTAAAILSWHPAGTRGSPSVHHGHAPGWVSGVLGPACLGHGTTNYRKGTTTCFASGYYITGIHHVEPWARPLARRRVLAKRFHIALYIGESQKLIVHEFQNEGRINALWFRRGVISDTACKAEPRSSRGRSDPRKCRAE